MNSAKHRLKGFGFSFIAALALMAYANASAEANWLLEGAELTANESVAAKPHTTWGLELSNGVKIISSKTEGKIYY